MWIKLHLLANCFNDGEKSHFGLQYNGKWYAITHSSGGVLIPKHCVKGNIKTKDSQFLKLITDSVPYIVKDVNGSINEMFVKNFNSL